MKTFLLILAGLVLTGCQQISSQTMQDQPPQEQEKEKTTTVMSENTAAMQQNSMMEVEKTIPNEPKVMMKDGAAVKPSSESTTMEKIDEQPQVMIETRAQYAEYSPEKYTELKGKKRFGIFFYANWCSTCRNWEDEFMGNMKGFPSETIILKANYDTETELIKELGVKTQSTLVLFNAEGKQSTLLVDPKIEVVSAHFQ